MLIAKVENNTVVDVADYRAMFPSLVFPASGPDDEFMRNHSCMYVNVWKPYDPETQKLVPATPPTIETEDGLHWVYTVAVAEMTPEELEERREWHRQMNAQQAATLLSAVDWVELGDVSDPANPPYLTNKADFTAYRQQLREIAVNPPVTVETWPVKPEEQWSSV
jgi:hypothetical protein